MASEPDRFDGVAEWLWQYLENKAARLASSDAEVAEIAAFLRKQFSGDRAEVERLKAEVERMREALESIVTINSSNRLNDYGGGNVGWWHDYIRSEIGRLEGIATAALCDDKVAP